MDVTLLFVFLVLGGLLMNCGYCRAWTSKDDWYTGPPPGEQTPSPRATLDPGGIHEVVEAQEAEAEEILQDVSIVGLSDQEAAELIGQPLPEAPGTRPYLVRGVYLNRGTGRFAVYVLSDQLVVHHGSLGSSAVPMKRQALVLQLEQAPAEVFVYCSMAQ